MSSKSRILHVMLVWAAALTLALSACSSAPASAPQPTRTPLPAPTAAPGSVAQVTRGSITYDIASRGRLMSSREATLSFQLGGLLRTLSVQPGSQVKQGEVLAELDAWDMESAVFEAQNEVDMFQVRLDQSRAARAQAIAAAQADLDVAKAQDAQSALARDRMNQQIMEGKVPHGRAEEQLIQDLTAQSDLDRAKLDQAEVRYKLALVNTEEPVLVESLKQAKAKLERLQSRLEEAKLRAPFDGVIVALDAQAGDNLQVYQKIGVIADPARPILVASVFEEDIPRVSVGQAAAVKFDDYPTQTFAGKVTQVGVQPIPSQGKNAYEVTINFDDPASVPASLRQGAEVSIVAQTKSDSLLVPARAVIREGIQSYVQVMREGGATRVPVQVGVSDGTNTVVLAGLQEGDTVKLQ
jgi:RND family efflux transporter MFP subunit